MRTSKVRKIVLGAASGVLAASTISVGSVGVALAPDVHGDRHQSGLGSYGPSGPIVRADLPERLGDYVSDEAIELAASPALADARAGWDEGIDFVAQVDYQLSFRPQTDYLSTDSGHLDDVLSARPDNVGIDAYGLYLTDSEAAELNRRLDLGDRIPAVEKELGVQPARVEGGEPAHPDNFGGVWQDQMDGGAIVVALVEPSLAKSSDLSRLVGGPDNLRVIDVEHSWNEVDGFSDQLVEQIRANDVKAEVRINSTGQGRQLEIVTPEPGSFPDRIRRSVPSEIVSVSEGPVDVPEGDPDTTHSASNQMPGLGIETDPGGWCTWGVNGHTSNYNYLVTAGHCGSSTYENFSGWTNDYEIHQNNSFHLTYGSQYLYSFNEHDYDAKRMSSSYANDNCYHSNYHCSKFIGERAYHNSWEINSDLVCATLGNTADYRCGYITQENYPSSGCDGDRWIRYSIDTQGGDSGSGIIGPVGDLTSIDGIHTCGSGDHGIGQTAFDVKDKLAFDFNCETYVAYRSASNWGTCPYVNR